MKTSILISLYIIFGSFNTFAQVRYKDPIFSNITIESNVYASGKTFENVQQDLSIDIYQPESDVATKRPILILLHGGAYLLANSKNDSEIVDWCTSYAKKGYVCVAVQYRRGIKFGFQNANREFYNASYRATIDIREAIKYVKFKHQKLKIDTNQIFGIGISAGAISLLHSQFVDTPAKLASVNPPVIDTPLLLDKNALLENISYQIKGIVNLCGAIGDVDWLNIDNKAIEILNIHGDKDATVPYKSDFFKIGSLNIVPLAGSFSLDSAAKLKGYNSQLHTFYGAGHVPFSPRNPNLATSKLYEDTTLALMDDFLYQSVVGVSEANEMDQNFEVYHSPQNEVVINNINQKSYSVDIVNILNITQLKAINIKTSTYRINTTEMQAGLYIIKIQVENKLFSKKILVSK